MYSRGTCSPIILASRRVRGGAKIIRQQKILVSSLTNDKQTRRRADNRVREVERFWRLDIGEVGERKERAGWDTPLSCNISTPWAEGGAAWFLPEFMQSCTYCTQDNVFGTKIYCLATIKSYKLRCVTFPKSLNSLLTLNSFKTVDDSCIRSSQCSKLY